MPCAGVQEESVVFGIFFNTFNIPHLETDHTGSVGSEILRIAQNDSGVEPVRSLELDGEITGYDSKVGGKGDNAAPAVAAHHSAASIRIVEDHPEVFALAFLQ